MKANLTANKSYVIGEISPRLYGSFIEHLGRPYMEASTSRTIPRADDMGFRKDVLELVRSLTCQ